MKISNLPKNIALISVLKENSLMTVLASSNTVPQMIHSPKRVNFILTLNKNHAKHFSPEN